MAGTGTGIVIDVGCATHGADQSIEPLIERFHPEVLYGFDPQVIAGEMDINGTRAILRDEAAWVFNGTLRFEGDNLGARVVGEGGREVRCIDLPFFVSQLETRPVLKLDCEGSEYPLIERLIETRIDAELELLLVEWHCPFCGHGTWSHAPSCEQQAEAEQLAVGLEEKLACPVERWEL